MEIEQLRKEINQVLANISEHSERFTGKEYLPALEISVLMSKINKLQELAAILKYKIQQKEESRRASNKLDQSSKINEPKLIEIETLVEPIKEVVVEEIIEVKNDLIEDHQEMVQKAKVETPLTKTGKSSISDKFLHTPLASLKDAFSLNDRYLFANELFKKDMALFNDTVKNIDACSSIVEARELLSKAKTELNWDTESDRVISFYDLVERRFS